MRILLVENDQAVAKTLVAVFQGCHDDWEVDVMASPQEAIYQVTATHGLAYNLLITDYNLGDPDCNGFQLAALLLADTRMRSALTRFIPKRAIIMSGGFPEDFHAQVAQAWASGVKLLPLQKPIKISAIEGLVACIMALP